MQKIERITASILLCIIIIANIATPVAYAAPQIHFHAKLPAPDFRDATTLAPSMPDLQPDQGSVLGESTSLLTVQAVPLDLDGGNGDSANIRIAPRMQVLPQRVYRSDEDVVLSVVNPDDEPVTTSVTDEKGNDIAVPVTESYDGTTTTVDFASSDTIKPGMFVLRMTDNRGQITTQDFSWGVLAMNFDRSEYHPGEKAAISFAVLDDTGAMVCDAQLTLTIKNEATGHIDTIASGDPGATGITVNPQCQNHAFSLEPDYEAQYTFGSAGDYAMTLTAIATGGTHIITDSVAVTNNIPFDVQRVSATRVYPPNTYPMLFNITANRDFSGTVTETVPDSFTITPATQSALEEIGQGGSVSSYSNMQTVYLNNNDPASNLQQAIVASDAAGLVMPFTGSYPITQGFGAELTDPSLQAFYTQFGLAGHDGVDFGVPMDTPLYAVDNGTVIWSGPGDYGITIIIQHGWGQSYYGHLSSTVAKVGQAVSKGELIGYSGESGDATGPHLHFGMRPNNPDMTNGYYGKIDPLPYLPFGHEPEPLAALSPITTIADEKQAGISQNDGSAVLGASDSGIQVGSPTPSPVSSPTVTGEPTISPTLEPSVTESASQSAVAVSPTQAAAPVTTTPTPSAFVNQEQSELATGAANESFSVLDKQIKLNEALAASTQTEKVKVITWQVNLKKGQSTTLGYDYQVPSVSPEFYMVGPVKFYGSKSNSVVYQEQRQWEIASDDVGVAWYYNTTGSTWNGYSWQYRKKLTINSSLVSATATQSGTVTFMDSGGQATNTNGGTDFTTTTGGMWDGVNGTVSYDTSTAENGPGSIKLVDSSGTEAYIFKNSILADTGRRISGYFNFGSFPSAGTGANAFLGANNSSTTAVLNVGLTPGGVLELMNNGLAQIGSSGPTLSTNTWYRIDLSYVVTSTTTYTARVYVNGVLVISVTNGSTLSANTSVDLYLGWDDADSSNPVMHIQDVYVDSGTDDSDTGDVQVTAKLPYSNGATDSFTPGGVGTPTGDTVCSSGTACEYINERPLNINEYLESQTTNSETEEFGIQSTTQGDVSIPTNAGIIADQAWFDMSSSAVCSSGNASIVNNGVTTNLTLPTTTTMELNYQTINSTGPYPNTTYPSGNTAIGLKSCSAGTAPTIKLYEAGIQIAYIPDLINFPVSVNITGDNDLLNHAASTGNDILFTDSTGQNLLNYQIENYSSGSLIAWVQVPSVSTASNSIIYMYYGNPSAASLANASGTWDKNYDGVFHLGSSSSISMTDATGINTGATNHGATAVAGEFYGGGAFTGSGAGDYMDLATDTSNLNPFNANPAENTFTFEAWYKVATYAEADLFSDDNNTTNGVEIAYDNACATLVYKATKQGSGTSDICIGAAPNDTNWHSLAVVYSSSGTQAYVDGSLSLPTSSNSVKFVSGTKDSYLGDLIDEGNAFQGDMDEIRFSGIARSAGWIKSEYNSENSPTTFYTEGNPETSAYAPTLAQVLRHGQFFGSTGQTNGILQPFTW